MSQFFATSADPAKNAQVISSYLQLKPLKNRILCEYIWIGGSGNDLRSKTKILDKPVNKLTDLPLWNFDGSSTEQAAGHFSEVWLRPVKYVRDPFRGAPNLLVLCECLNSRTMQPIPTNLRGPAQKIFETKEVKEEKPWYGIEQEYTLFEPDGMTPLGWPKNGFPGPQGPYYCGVGARRAYGRQVAEAHIHACLYSGIRLSGINGEVMPGQWEFQVGPCEGVDSGDSLWLARYILERVAEDFNIVVSFSAKPIMGDWNGAGCHTNYSTLSMRTDPKSVDDSKDDSGRKYGMDAILEGIGKLGKFAEKHINAYGKGNKKRLVGTHETAKWNEFRYGVANRGASIRIPRQADIDGYGYLEDRRPSANMDPYLVTSLIAETTILAKVDAKTIGRILEECKGEAPADE